jgi:serine/threonine-protein kinase
VKNGSLRSVQQRAADGETGEHVQTLIRRSRRVTILGGARARLSDQMRLLLRSRLRVVGTLVLAGSLLFLLWSVIVGNLDYFGDGAYATWMRIGVVVAVAWATYELWQPRLPEWRELRTAELIIFGTPMFLMLAVQYLQFADRNAAIRIPFSTGPWIALLFTYAMFIPNSWRRAARVMLPAALAPVLISIAAGWQRENLPDNFWELLSGLTLMLLIVTAIAIYGTHVINALRIQAFEATQLGQYRLRELLGSGGMGDVWLAEHQLLKRPCAIKLIDAGRAADPRAQTRFEREVRATAQLSHWNIVEIYDYGRTDDGTFYYVMEYLPGLTLAEIVESHGPMPPARAINLLRQACSGLHLAHSAGLIHRDIKPGNIIAAYRGGMYDVIKLVDFGLVELRGEVAGRSWNSASMFSGSPLFIAPEQALGGSDPDPRSDIYSLGAVGYYLLTGRPPFEGTKPLKIVIAHAHDPVTPPSQLVEGIPPDLEEILLRCLAKSPADRFANVQELDQALAECELASSWTNRNASEWWQSHEAAALGQHARTVGIELPLSE